YSPATPSGTPSIRDSICYNSIWMADNNTNASAYTYNLYLSPSATANMELYLYNNIIVNRNVSAQNGYYGVGIYRASTSGLVYSDFNDVYCNTLGSGSDPYHATG